MCTASWFASADGYEVFFNRDERRTRKEALPPTITTDNGVSFITPADTNAGGTWMGVNQYGMTLCLLNYYVNSGTLSSSSTYVSRGILLRNLLHVRDKNELNHLFSGIDFMQYQPFTMLAFDDSGACSLFRWRGETSKKRLPESTQTVFPPVSSSSFQTAEVIQNRMNVYESCQSGKNQRDNHLKYHASHVPDKSAFSVCMHRDDARTVSFSHLIITGSTVSFAYYPGSPCSAAPLTPIELSRSGV